MKKVVVSVLATVATVLIGLAVEAPVQNISVPITSTLILPAVHLRLI